MDTRLKWIVFVLPFALGLWVLWCYGISLVDDGYYYLQIAWHAAQGHGFTFDGMHHTNGFHPLWQVMLIPFFWLFNNKTIVPYAVSLLQLTLYAFSGLLFYKAIDLLTANKSLAGFVLFMLMANAWFFFKGAMTGMETALVLFLVGLALVYIILVIRYQSGFISAGIILMLLVAARFEMILFVMSVSFFLLLWQKHKKLYHLPLYSMLYLAGYFLVNAFYFNHFFPISGTIKSAYGKTLFLEWWAGSSTEIFNHILHNIKAFLTLNRLPIEISIFLVFIFAAYYVWVCLRAVKSIRLLVLIVLSFSLCTVFCYSFFYENVLETWKYYWLPLIFANMFLFSATLSTVSEKLRYAVMVFFIFATILFSGIYLRDLHRNALALSSQSENPRSKMVAYINQNLAEDALLGSWDAGYLGYFCSQRLINLDGLVNNFEILPYIKQERIFEYIDRKNIDYLVNQNLQLNHSQWSVLHNESIKIPAARRVTTFTINPNYIDVIKEYELEYSLYQRKTRER